MESNFQPGLLDNSYQAELNSREHYYIFNNRFISQKDSCPIDINARIKSSQNTLIIPNTTSFDRIEKIDESTKTFSQLLEFLGQINNLLQAQNPQLESCKSSETYVLLATQFFKKNTQLIESLLCLEQAQKETSPLHKHVFFDQPIPLSGFIQKIRDQNDKLLYDLTLSVFFELKLDFNRYYQSDIDARANRNYLRDVEQDPSIIFPVEVLLSHFEKLGVVLESDDLEAVKSNFLKAIQEDILNITKLQRLSHDDFKECMAYAFMHFVCDSCCISYPKKERLRELCLEFQKFYSDYANERKRVLQQYRSNISEKDVDSSKIQFSKELKYALEGKLKKDLLDLPNEKFVLEMGVLKDIFSAAKEKFTEGLKNEFDDVVSRLRSKQPPSPPKTWEPKKAANKNFTFSQNAWGKSTINEDGACFAINYRWIKSLMRNPFGVITSPDDLDPMTADSSVKVLPFDRKIQTEYALSHNFTFRKIYGRFPRTNIFKRDGFKQCQLFSNESFASGNDILQRLLIKEGAKPFLHLSSGILELGLFDDKDGHSLGIQIDSTHNIYRFWDVNAGFYTYDNLEDLKAEFSRFLSEFYLSKFTEFSIRQLSPVEKKSEALPTMRRRCRNSARALYKRV